MSKQIFRLNVATGVLFYAPENITLGFQPQRESFSAWFVEDDANTTEYIVLPTGLAVERHPIYGDEFVIEIKSSVVLPDGSVYHLVKIKPLRI